MPVPIPQPENNTGHGRSCIGDHVVLCVDSDGGLLTFPDLEHPERVARAISVMVRAFQADPEAILCMVGACQLHEAQA